MTRDDVTVNTAQYIRHAPSAFHSRRTLYTYCTHTLVLLRAISDYAGFFGRNGTMSMMMMMDITSLERFRS